MNLEHNGYQKIIFFDTTLRDGELAQGVRMGVYEKVAIASLLDQVGVDAIEVGYPGYSEKDFDEIRQVAASVKQPIICGLAGSKEDEIVRVAEALAAAQRSRINVFTPNNLVISFSALNPHLPCQLGQIQIDQNAICKSTFWCLTSRTNA